MRVAFRVDAGVKIGSGHLSRCLALADAWCEREFSCVFLLRDATPQIRDWVQARGHAFHCIQKGERKRPLLITASEATYADWLSVSEREDADDCCDVLKQYVDLKLVVVDHYALGSDWEQSIAQAGYRVLAIDDLCRAHNADAIVDQTYSRATSAYQLDAHQLALMGSDYALISSAFYRHREIGQRTQNIAESSQRKLLISFGAVDQVNATLAVLQTLEHNCPKWVTEIVLLLSEHAPHYAAVKAYVANSNLPMVWHHFLDDMASELNAVFLAIGAPGVSTWERACLGVPSVLISIADNQRDVAAAVCAANLAQVLSLESLTQLSTALNQLQQSYDDYSRRNLLCCDGLGTRRVVTQLMPPHANDGQSITLRKANHADIELVYRWQCQPETRLYARNPVAPTWTEHQQWMTAALQNPDIYFYVIMHDCDAAGVVRLHRQASAENHHRFEISIFVAAEKQRLGLAAAAIQIVQQWHLEATLLATVLRDNIASKNLFLRCQFQAINATEYQWKR